MLLRMSGRKIDELNAARAREVEERNRRILEQSRVESDKTIRLFNAGMAPGDRDRSWSPLLFAALQTGHHWLHVFCPGCRTIAAIDLTLKPRKRTTSIIAIVEEWKCEMCRGQATEAHFVKLSKHHVD